MQETKIYTFISGFTVLRVLFTGINYLNLKCESGSAFLKLVGIR